MILDLSPSQKWRLSTHSSESCHVGRSVAMRIQTLNNVNAIKSGTHRVFRRQPPKNSRMGHFGFVGRFRWFWRFRNSRLAEQQIGGEHGQQKCDRPRGYNQRGFRIVMALTIATAPFPLTAPQIPPDPSSVELSKVVERSFVGCFPFEWPQLNGHSKGTIFAFQHFFGSRLHEYISFRGE